MTSAPAALPLSAAIGGRNLNLEKTFRGRNLNLEKTFRGNAMTPSRRSLFQAVGVGALIAAGAPEVLAADATAPVPAQGMPAAPPPSTPTAQSMPPDFGKASSANIPVNIVSPEHLEAEARKAVSPGRFAITGWCGEGLTYRANRASLARSRS
jgi:hypothetical protein